MTSSTSSPSPSSVSRALAARGCRPVTDRNREGIRVASGRIGPVRVSVDIDSPVLAAERFAEATEALEAAGYRLERHGLNVVHVVGRRS